MLWAYRGVRGPMNPLTPAKVSCPQAHHGRWGPVARLMDGRWDSSTVSTMWGSGVVPEITVDLGRAADLDQIVLRTWEALGGGDSYGLGKVEVHASDTGRAGSFRKVRDDLPVATTEIKSGKNRNSIRQATGLDCRARYVRLVVHPASKTKKAYLAEVLMYESAEKAGEPGRVMDVAAADLDGDGPQEVVVAGSDGAAHCLRSDGAVAWTFRTGGEVNAVWAGKLAGATAVLVGSEDAHVYRLDAAGKEVWRRRLYHYRGASGQDGGVCRITVARLDPAQPPCILVGADNWHLSLLTPGGKELRHTYYYAHETSCLRTADLDGDGRREIINCTSFADGNVFDHQALKSTRIAARLGPGIDAATGDLDGDGKKEIVLAGQSGIAAAGRDGKRLWRFDTNCPQTCVRAVDLDGDGKAEIVTAGIDRSLKLMNTDHVDILLLHSCDADHLKRDDLIAALVGAKQAGKARFIGYSGDGEAAELAVGMEQFDCLETSVSICDQQCIEKYLGTALQRGMGVIAKRPIANACWRNLAEYDTFYSEYARAYTERLGVMDISPETLGFDGSWAELALRFTLSQPAVATAIVGTTRLDHVQENLDARRKGPLDASTMQAIVAEWKRCDDGSWVAKT